ncbi:MAG TPA: Na+-dependent transporter [Sphingobium sp.]|uniref:Na+-dependent transporter n=1 Tax=Sphingobium sp. TaxID=1912891 RepID=UPI002ED191A9
MELVKHLIPLMITVSLGLLIVSCGMASARGECLHVLRSPRLLVKAMIAINVIPPVAAILAVSLFPAMPIAAKGAILLMAISPVPPLVPGKALKMGGSGAYVYGLQVAVSLLAIITVPLLGTLVGGLYESDAQFPVSVIARNVFVGMVIPLAIGLALGRWIAPDFSHRAAPMVTKIALGLVVIAFLPILIKDWSLMMALVGDGTVLAMLAVVIVAAIGGYLLGEKAPGDRATLMFAATTRHPGIALALAGANHAKPGITAGVLLFLLIALAGMVPYQIAFNRRRKAEATSAAA